MISEAREYVLNALSALDVTIYADVPSQLTPPCLHLEPSLSTWVRVEPVTLDSWQYAVTVDIVATSTATAGSSRSWSQLEHLVDGVIAVIAPDPSARLESTISGPDIATVGAAELIQTRIPVTITIKE